MSSLFFVHTNPKSFYLFLISENSSCGHEPWRRMSSGSFFYATFYVIWIKIYQV